MFTLSEVRDCSLMGGNRKMIRPQISCGGKRRLAVNTPSCRVGRRHWRSTNAACRARSCNSFQWPDKSNHHCAASKSSLFNPSCTIRISSRGYRAPEQTHPRVVRSALFLSAESVISQSMARIARRRLLSRFRVACPGAANHSKPDGTCRWMRRRLMIGWSRTSLIS